MRWFSVDEFLPGHGSGYVIARVENSDQCDFVYQAMFTKGKWEFWDEEYWPIDRLKNDKFRVTHWTYMPNFPFDL